MNILEKIDKLRVEKEWSIYRLAEESMINQSTLANMFARKTQPSISTLTSLCNGLGITLAQFFAEDQLDIKKEKEISLLIYYNKLGEKEKDAIVNLAKNLSENY